MPKIGYRDFSGGLNYRDDVIAVNELKSGNNLYWEGNLKRRNGYEIRNAELESPDTGDWPSSGIQIIDYVRLKCASGSDQFFIFGSMQGSGKADTITAWYCSGLPNTTNESFTQINNSTHVGSHGYGEIIAWSTSDPFSVTPFNDKVWIALGDNNPYVMYYDTSSGIWLIHESPLCLHSNGGDTGNTDGTSIIPGDTGNLAVDNGGWGGASIVAASNDYLYVSDGKTVYWAIHEGNVRPDVAIESTVIDNRASGVINGSTSTSAYRPNGDPGWDNSWFSAFGAELLLADAEAHRKYAFFHGEGGIGSIYMRNAGDGDYDIVVETQTGVYGKAILTESGIFFVGKDGIYGYDGLAGTNLSKKIWVQIDGEHSDVPNDFSECSLAYHKGYVFISFPNGTNKEVYRFDPDLIYTDERGDSHVPLYRETYKAMQSTGTRSSMDLEILKDYDGHLFGITRSTIGHSTKEKCVEFLVELDYGAYDELSTGAGNNGIDWSMQTAFDDQGSPGIRKTYRQAVIETNEDLADGTTGGAYDVEFTAMIENCTDYTHMGLTTWIDLSYTTGAAHALKTIDIPYSSTGSWALDGNNMSIQLEGKTYLTTQMTAPTTDAVNIFGIDLDYDVQQRPLEEVS